MIKGFFWIAISLGIVAAAQPDWSVLVCLLSSAVGFALFWKGCLTFSSLKSRFLIGTVWFGTITAIQISWLTSDHYVGSLIYILYFFLVISWGIQFGFLTCFIRPPNELTFLRILGISGLWACLEWSRLFLLSGYTWNPIGLAMSSTLVGLQMASVIGVYGLSFWIILTNLMAFRLWTSPFNWRRAFHFILVASTPYLFGVVQLALLSQKQKEHTETPFSVVLVQTSILPEEKVRFISGVAPLSPDLQWKNILNTVAPYYGKKIDMIILPEGAVPYGTDLPIYPANILKSAFKHFFGQAVKISERNAQYVGNGDWCQALANTFKSDVIIGLEAFEENTTYVSAVLFKPFSESRGRYDKRVLLPIAEYFPCSWLKNIATRYGIDDCFTAGSEAKVFSGSRCALGFSICYEETFGHLMSENKGLGAQLFVNLTNDTWYPYTRLPIVHYLHARLRTVEMGIPLVRSCNTGVTCGIDSLGRTVGLLDYETSNKDSHAGALHLSLSSFTYSTLYSIWGDWMILLLSSSTILIGSIKWLWGVLIYRKAKNKAC